MDKLDEQMHKGLMALLNEGDFTIKRKDAIKLLQIIDWAENKLPLRLKQANEKPQLTGKTRGKKK